MATIVRGNDITVNQACEPPFSIRFGVENKTVESPRMVMGYTILPPGGRNQRHYFIKCDTAMYIHRGRLRLFFGPEHNQEEVVVDEGDFVHIPKGEIYGLLNLSETETAEFYFALGQDVASVEEAMPVMVDPPWI